MNSAPPRDTSDDIPEPIAWAVYGGRTGVLRYVLQDEERVFELTESGYIARPLFEHPAPTPPAKDVREAAGRLSSHAWHGETYGRPTTVVEVSDLRLVLNALTAEVRPRGTVTEEPAETYAVYGGQGLRRIASGLSREDAERVSRKFEIDCMNAGLTNPPGRIEREARS
ncbi:hypothetical protein [uncultured Microbacterium sp.]|uniref:hypothetical protein n=1 Tax=uncultured Microbacterium sp. TaxID=191216 RepID=UPI0025F8787D|nr:hypothetical protein [uncultured Microbacterium sp.]